jgi:phenylpyruvate tautomerase PptA (4-oxalocrotonate tautomerase family)
MVEGKSAEYKAAIFSSIYDAMRETFNVPEKDKFMSIEEHKRENICYGENYMNIERSDNLLMVEITASDTRTITQKAALYDAIVRNLVKSIHIRPEDVFICLVEVKKENWSFGYGKAQYASQ